MKVFLTGATGYIGGIVAEKLKAAGYDILGLVRSNEGVQKLISQGIEPVKGSLPDSQIVAEAIQRVDAVINTADADNRDFIEVVLPSLQDSGKTLIHTSGTSVLADEIIGEVSDRIFDEETPLNPQPDKIARLEIDRSVLDGAKVGIRSIVIRPSLIYGRGGSIQVPLLIAQAKNSGIARYIGKGENIWSNVHIEDIGDLYLLALEKASPGSLFHVGSGEASMKTVVEAISRMLGFDGTESWSLEAAVKFWGWEPARFALASNSRVSSLKARQQLGWNPKHPSLLEDIENGSYRGKFSQHCDNFHALMQ